MKTMQGGCHCGRGRFQVTVDLDRVTVCNCSICIKKGFLQRTPRGRLLTSAAFKHLGLAEPQRDPAQFGLFSGEEDD